MKFVEKRLPAVKAVEEAFTNTEVLLDDVALIQPTVGEEDALMFTVPPSATEAPPEARPEYVKFTEEFCRSVFATVAQVAAPAPLRLLTNWLVQAPLPVYAVAVPFAEPRKSAPGIEETVRLVVEALVAVMAVVEAFVIVAFAAMSVANEDVDDALIPLEKFR